MVDPKILSRQRLLGEHNEIHKHLPSLYKGVKIDGRFNGPPQIQLNALQSRHDELADEMARRGYNHSSPIEIDDYLIWKNYPQYYDIEVDIKFNMDDLKSRE